MAYYILMLFEHALRSLIEKRAYMFTLAHKKVDSKSVYVVAALDYRCFRKHDL